MELYAKYILAFQASTVCLLLSLPAMPPMLRSDSKASSNKRRIFGFLTYIVALRVLWAVHVVYAERGGSIFFPGMKFFGLIYSYQTRREGRYLRSMAFLDTCERAEVSAAGIMRLDCL